MFNIESKFYDPSQGGRERQKNTDPSHLDIIQGSCVRVDIHVIWDTIKYLRKNCIFASFIWKKHNIQQTNPNSESWGQ